MIKKTRKRLPEKMYIGVLDSIAKSATFTGFDPIVIMSDVYAAHFAHYAVMESIETMERGNTRFKWGIVEISTLTLDFKKILPFYGYVEKANRKDNASQEEIIEKRKEALRKIQSTKVTWQKSFESCGVVMYSDKILSENINRICTFDPHAKDTNQHILQEVVTFVGPWEVTAAEHKKRYETNNKINQWLMCYNNESSEWAQNRNNLDIFYQKAAK